MKTLRLCVFAFSFEHGIHRTNEIFVSFVLLVFRKMIGVIVGVILFFKKFSMPSITPLKL